MLGAFYNSALNMVGVIVLNSQVSRIMTVFIVVRLDILNMVGVIVQYINDIFKIDNFGMLINSS